MKRLFALLLLLLMLPVLGMADQDILINGANGSYDNIQVLHRSCYPFSRNGIDNVFIFYEVKNAGRNPVDIDSYKTAFVFYDASGRELWRQNGFIGTSYHILPGQTSVLYSHMSSDDEKDVPYASVMKAAEYGLDLGLVARSPSEKRSEKSDHVFLETRSSLRVVERNPLLRLLGGSHYVYMMDVTVTNTTGVDLTSYAGGFTTNYILRDENGNPVAVDHWHTPFTKIKAGETVTFTQELSLASAIKEMFDAYDFVPSSGETQIFVDQSTVDYFKNQ